MAWLRLLGRALRLQKGTAARGRGRGRGGPLAADNPWLGSWLGFSRTVSAGPDELSHKITASEALGALRPFYLSVHPDRFVQFPRQQATNEEALKQLNSYLDALGTSATPKPVQLTFYMHGPSTAPGNSSLSGLRQISLSLFTRSFGATVLDILESCDLTPLVSNAILNKLSLSRTSERRHQTLDNSSVLEQEANPFVTYDIDDFESLFARVNRTKSQPSDIEGWLRESLPSIREHCATSEAIREENDMLMSAICRRFGVGGVSFDSEWAAHTLRGHLRNLLWLLEEQGRVLGVGWEGVTGGGVRVVLGRAKGVSADSSVHLDCEETLQQWVEFLPFITNSLFLARTISPAEKKLSGQLGGVAFVRPSISCQDYCKLLLAFEEQCGCAEFQSEEAESRRTWCRVHRPFEGVPISLTSHAQDVSQSISPSGVIQVSIPTSSLPSSSLSSTSTSSSTFSTSSSSSHKGMLDYLKRFHLQARLAKANYLRRQQKTAQTLERCEQQLCLGCLRTSSILTEAQIIHGCCSLLSLSSPSSRSGVSDDASGLLSGLRVCLGTHYAVSADGEVRLPWNFVTGVSKSASNCDSHTV